jgi:hypothetical protein
VASQTTLSEIEQKIVGFLRDAGAPNLPSQIAASIHETRRETTAAVLLLEHKAILYRETNCAFLTSTGETYAFGLKKSV